MAFGAHQTGLPQGVDLGLRQSFLVSEGGFATMSTPTLRGELDLAAA